MNNNGVTNNQNINSGNEPVLTPIDNTQQPVAPPTIEPAQPAAPAAPAPTMEPTIVSAPVEAPVQAQPVIEATPQPAEQPTIVQPTPAPAPATPEPTTPEITIPSAPVEDPQINTTIAPEINQGVKVDAGNDNYQALQTNLNSIDQPLNQIKETPPSPDDMNTEYVDEGEEATPQRKKRFSLTPILLLIILGLGGYTLISAKNYKSQVEQLRYKCTPVTSYKEAKELDLDSTLVKDLYSKVKTNIREDIAEPEWNNKMKLYLAFRQIPNSEMYESNCNMFDPSKMEPFTCVDSSTYTPKAFKSSALTIEWKKLFGENTQLTLDNVSLTNLCIGGYEYIPERDEYVQGQCEKQNAISYKVDKELIKAVTYRNTIILTEKVKYHENEKMALPDYLKSGEYLYTFRLDMNYNYVLISKAFNDKYS